MSDVFHPIFIYLAVAVGFVVVTLVATHLLPRVRKTPVKMMPYESGVDPVGDARGRFDVRYYAIAIAFLIFDVEVLLLFPGAVAFGKKVFASGGGGVSMTVVFVELMVFIALLAVAYVYAWRKGVFRWR